MLSIGAGIYEELVFRLVAFNVLSFLLIDVLRWRRLTAVPVMILDLGRGVQPVPLQAVGPETFSSGAASSSAALAGVYFGVIFACRGFGLTAGAHAGYDVAVVLLRAVGPI